MRTKLSGPDTANEGRALIVLITACFIIFVSEWPMLSKMAQADPSIPLEARAGAALFACLFVLPLIAYALASITRGVAWLFKGKGSGLGARLSLFYALLAISPVMLLRAIAVSADIPQTILFGISLMMALSFLYLWINMTIGAERK